MAPPFSTINGSINPIFFLKSLTSAAVLLVQGITGIDNSFNVSEIFSQNFSLCFNGEEFEQNKIKLQENSPSEIRDLAIEMDERLNENWNETNEDKLLQKKFWSLFNENMQKLNLKKPIHGKV